MPSQLAAISTNPEVIEYAQGAAQDALTRLQVASFLAPQVQVPGVVGRYKKYSEKNKFRIPRTRRANNGRATELGFTAEDATFTLAAHALDFPVDQQELDDPTLINIFQEGADMCAEVAALSHEKDVVDLALEALGDGDPAVFDANTDPVKFLDQQILAVLKSAKYGSLMGIRVLFGASAWLIFKNHPKITAKFVNNPKGAANPQVTPEMATSLLLTNPEIATTYSVYDDAPEGVAEDVKFVLDSNIIVFACKPTPTRRDPSFMKTFVKRGAFMVPGSYVRDDGRVEVAKFDWQVQPAVTNAPAGVRLNVSES